MIISYHGHSTFKLKGKRGTVVTDPYHEYVGFQMPSISADVVTVSHDHKDHAASELINGTARRKNPFIIHKPGEYEVGGISVFGVSAFHDASQGAERGTNIIYTVLLDDLRVCHLGDLGHELTQDHIEAIGDIDILFVPVGGVYTIDPATAVKTVRALEPAIAIPMHFKTPEHDANVFGELATVEDFIKEFGVEVSPQAKLDISKNQLPEETELVVLTAI